MSCSGGYLDVSVLLGKTIKSVGQEGDIGIIFTITKGEEYKLYHPQDVYLEKTKGGY